MATRASARPNVISTRVSNAGFAAIEKIHIERGLDYSSIARILFAVALKHPREIEQMLEAHT